MKKFIGIFICICMLILTSCINTGDAYDKSVNDSDTITYSNNGVITNTERLDKFIENVADMKKDRININRFTDEGDPIITQFYFNKTNIEIFIDRSKDKFGGKDKDKIIHETIDNSDGLIEALNKYLVDNNFLIK
ncbi:MAG: DUF4362 domain-containing protein [Mobilitalea sp.]